MKILIAHLSDFHIKADSKIDESKAESIGRVIYSESIDCEQVFICITGDIAHSGKSEEYERAKLFLDSIISNASGREIHTIMCPGNHDCNYEDHDTTRERLIDGLREGKDYDDRYVWLVSKVLNKYCDFEIENASNTVNKTSISKEHIADLGKTKIKFKCFYSPWMSTLDTKPGQTMLPAEHIEIQKSNDYVDILLMHHTINWYRPEEQRIIRRAIAKYDIVMTGHEHEAEKYSLVQRNNSKTIMVEGDILSPFVDTKRSGFNIVEIDLHTDQCRTRQYKYSRKNRIYALGDAGEWDRLQRGDNIVSNGYKLRKEFSEHLADPGAPYRHQNVASLKFEDIFIYPDLREIAKQKNTLKKFSDTIVSLKSVLHDKNSAMIYLIGGERSGKSAICKHVLMDRLDRDVVGILINGSDVVSAEKSHIDSILADALGQQFYDLTYPDFCNLHPSLRAIIIDDYHKCELINSDKAKFLLSISSFCDNIIVAVDEYMQFDIFLSGDQESQSLRRKFQEYIIMPFGHRLRAELAKKWVSLGNPCSDNDMLRAVDGITSMLDVVVCKNFVPPYPFYLYTAVSAYEGSNKDSLAESSYASYYDLLLKTVLYKVDRRPKEIDLRLSYLAEFAYYLYGQKRPCISAEDFSKFHSHYCVEYQLSKPFDSFVAKFFSASILQNQTESISFRYKYFYYYFLAKYLSTHIHHEVVENIIIDLCVNLHMESASNVLMFLTHLSKSNKVLDSIVEQADSLFLGNKPLRLDDDIAFANDLIGQVPHLTLRAHTVEEFRNQQLSFRDQVDPCTADSSHFSGHNIDMEPQPIQDAKPGPDRLLLQLGSALRTIDIIGIILKNHYGSLRGSDKISLCEQGYSLPLKTLTEYFCFVSQNKDSLLREIGDVLLTKRSKVVSSTDIDRRAKQYVFSISQIITFSILKRVATSLGSSDLNLTFKNVLGSHDINSYHLLDMAIKLEHCIELPLDEIKQLLHRFKNDLIASSVLRDLVVYKMYMYNIPMDIRQKACALLNISLSKQLLASASVRERGIHV